MSNTELAKKNPIHDLRDMLEKAGPKLAEVAPKHIKIERLVRLMLSSASRNPKILECSPASVLTFCMKCSETGLEPIGAGGAWAIPFGKELTFIPDYRGLVNCAKRSDCIKDAYAEVVYSNDEFDYSLGLEMTLTHKPARGDRGSLESAYCVIVFPDDTKRFIVMSKDEVESIRKRSRAATSGPWVTDEGEMWKKTVVRRAMKPFAGASQALDAAIEADNRASGLLDVTERPPVAMPKSKTRPNPVAESSAPEPEGTPEAKDAPETKTQPRGDKEQGGASLPPCETVENAVTAVFDKKKGKYRIETKDAGVFFTENVDVYDKAIAAMNSGERVTLHFRTKEDGQWLEIVKS